MQFWGQPLKRLLASFVPPLFRSLQGLMYLGWMLNTVMTLAVLYGMWRVHAYGILPSRAGAVVYASISRTLWAVSMAWIVFACQVGYGGMWHLNIKTCVQRLCLTRVMGTFFCHHPECSFDRQFPQGKDITRHLVVPFLA